MFGATIDYWILRPFTHNRGLETEEALNARYSADRRIHMEHAQRRIDKLQRRLQGRFPIRSDFSYLDIGCGDGEITLALAARGAGKVTGVDMVPRHISSAIRNRESLGMGECVDFVLRDIHDWTPPQRYDVVLSHEALEHIHDPCGFIALLSRFIKDDGIAVLAFGPLFRSAFGDHMDGFFRVPIPWRGVLFSEQAVLRLRRMQFRPNDGAQSYPEIVGGLNLLGYTEFLRSVAETGWELDYLEVNPQLRKIAPAYWLSNALVRVPVVRDYVASSIYAILRRAGSARQSANRNQATFVSA